MNNTRKFLIALALTAFAGVASAVPITGSIGFNGAYTTDSGDLLSATKIFITDATVDGVVTGSFADAGITDGDVAAYSDFVFAPAGAVAAIWKVGGFTFDLNAMSVDFQSSALLGLSGTGMISKDDASLDAVFGTWTFTANKTGSNFTFSSGTAPEPAMVLLLATGLIGFGFARKARKSA